jgi:hypothetical protein
LVDEVDVDATDIADDGVRGAFTEAPVGDDDGKDKTLLSDFFFDLVLVSIVLLLVVVASLSAISFDLSQ